MEPGANPPAGGEGGDMDDILASIRRILHSDDAAETPVPEQPAPTVAPRAEEIIDLHPSMRVNAGPGPRAIGDRLEASNAPQSVQPDHVRDSLLGVEAAAESAASLAALRAALADRQAPPPVAPSVPIYRAGGPTIEDVVRDEVRQLLKSWLDENLPPMVERMVRAEIARIATQS